MGRVLNEILKPFLEPLGFVQGRRGVFTYPMRPEVRGRMGFPNGLLGSRGEFELTPVVSVIFDEVDELVQELRRETRPKHFPSTFSLQLNALVVPRQVLGGEWRLMPGEYERGARAMVDVIVRFGIPFMQGCTSLLRLCELFDGDSKNFQWFYSRPVALFLCGEKSRASAALDEAERSFGEQKTAAATSFHDYAKRFREQLLAEGGAEPRE